MGLVAGLLVIVAPGSITGAQSNHPPAAVIFPLGQPDSDGKVTLNGSASFDSDDGVASEACGRCTYQWEVLTQAYAYLEGLFDDGDSDTADDTMVAITKFTLPDAHLVALYGTTIEFQLTVTDTQGATGVATAIYRIQVNRKPTAAISVSAMLYDRGDNRGYDDNGNGKIDENGERYALEGVIDGPGENGNADNEWDIREGSLLVVDGSNSSDPEGPLTEDNFRWVRLYASDVTAVTASLPGNTEGQKVLSTDEDPDVADSVSSETIARLPAVGGDLADPYYLYYMLTVTDDGGAADTQVVKIVIRDAHANPTVVIGHPESDPGASGTAASREGVQPAGENRYVISPEVAEEGITLTAVGTGDGAARTRGLVHTWSGEGAEPSESNRPGSSTTVVFTEHEDTVEGDSFVVEVEVVDPTGLSGSTAVELVVADNSPPIATVPPDIDTPDGANGGFPEADPPTGVVRLRGFGVDSDGGPLAFKWEQVRNSSGDPLTATYQGRRVALNGSDTETASFRVPEVTRGTQYVVYVLFTVTDQWGVSASEVVTITIRDGDDDLRAITGADQRVQAGEVALLRGNFSSGLVSADAINAVVFSWAYTGIETHPGIDDRTPISDAEIARGFAPGEWLPSAGGSYDPAAGGRVRNADTQFPFFVAPEPGGFNSVKFIFELTVRSGDDTDIQTVTITVVNGFFSGVVDGPDFCANLSLGGPTTYPFDSDDDEVADVCVLNGTRRFNLARQRALETLGAIHLDNFKNALHGTPADPDSQDIDEATDACATAPDDLGDAPGDLLQDVCGRAEWEIDPEHSASPRPPSVDPMLAPVFFSGVINSPHYCANFSLGGFITYAYDSDNDGVADVCALPYTRREAVARQNALETAFADHPQFPAALAAACTALGTLDFGDTPAALATDACAIAPSESEKGQPLPTPG